PRLEWLSLREQHGGGGGKALLAGWPGLSGLTRLANSGDARGGGHGHEGAHAEGLGRGCRSPPLGPAAQLDTRGTRHSRGALEAFLDAPNLSSLRVLNLDMVFYHGPEEPCQNEAARLLTRCSHFSDELELHFNEGHLSNAARRLLRDRFGDRLFLYPDD